MGVVGDDELYRKHAEDLIRLATGLVGQSDAADVVSAAVVDSIDTNDDPLLHAVSKGGAAVSAFGNAAEASE